jgi:hypothetical protein
MVVPRLRPVMSDGERCGFVETGTGEEGELLFELS